MDCREQRLMLDSLDGGAALEQVGRDVPSGMVLGCYFFIPTSDTYDDLGAYLLPVSAWNAMLDRCEAAGIVTLWPHSRRCWEVIEARTYLLELSACKGARAWATPTAPIPRGDYRGGAADAVLRALRELDDEDEQTSNAESAADEDERFVVKLGYGAYGGHVRIVDDVGGILDAIDALFAEGHEAKACLLQRFVPHAVEARVWVWRLVDGGGRFGAFVDEWTAAVPYIDHRRGGEDGQHVVPRRVTPEAAVAALRVGERSCAKFQADLAEAAARAAEVVAGILRPHSRDEADTTSFRLDLLMPPDQPREGVAFRLVEVTPAHGDVEDLEMCAQVLKAKWSAALESVLGAAHPKPHASTVGSI